MVATLILGSKVAPFTKVIIVCPSSTVPLMRNVTLAHIRKLVRGKISAK